MTISAAPTPLSYSGDGSTTSFPVVWKYNAKSHIVATLRSTTGTETTWALTTNYTLTDPGDTGTLTAVVAPASGETLVISLEPPNTQSSDIPLGGEFPSVTVEDGLDLAAQRDQKIQSLFDRSLRVPRTDTKTGSALELPIDTTRAGKYLAFDADGDPIASAAAAGTAVVSTFMETVLDDTTAAAARTTLGAVGLTGNETIAGDKTLSGNTIASGTVTMSGKSIIEANAAIAAHATTMDPWSLGNYVTLTGAAVTFTALANAPKAGAEVELYMNDAHVFTDGAVFEVDGDANWTAEVGDRVLLRAKSTTVFTVHPRKKTGQAVTAQASGTVVATTSGTEFDFTIPAWVTRIDILLAEVSLSGTDNILVQIGDSGGIETTEYVSTRAAVTSTTATASSTAGFIVAGGNAGFIASGVASLRLLNAATNLWVLSSTIKASTVFIHLGGGSKALSAALTTVRITRTGTDTFDAGSINVMWG